MFIIDLSKRINRRLIHSFDGNRIKYMFFVFPAYQFLAMIGMASILFSFQSIATALYFLPLGLILTLFIGVPVLTSWYLSCLLFGLGYFEFLARLGIPFMPWVARELEGGVNWFRPRA